LIDRVTQCFYVEVVCGVVLLDQNLQWSMSDFKCYKSLNEHINKSILEKVDNLICWFETFVDI
jgi:hypothetical protein